MLIKNVSERSLGQGADGTSKNGDILSTEHAASKKLDESSKTTNQHYSPLLRQVNAHNDKQLITN